MTREAPRTTDREELASAQQRTVDAVEETREAWEFDPTNIGATVEQCYGIISADGGGWSICYVPVHARGFKGDWDAAAARAKADAALIAQAPTLRADVERLTANWKNLDKHHEDHHGADQDFETAIRTLRSKVEELRSGHVRQRNKTWQNHQEEIGRLTANNETLVAALAQANTQGSELRADVERVQGFNKEFQDENTRLTAELADTKKRALQYISGQREHVLRNERLRVEAEGESEALRTALRAAGEAAWHHRTKHKPYARLLWIEAEAERLIGGTKFPDGDDVFWEFYKDHNAPALGEVPQ